MSYCVYLAGSSTAWISKTSWVVELIKIIVFAVLLIVDLTVGLGSAKSANSPKAEEENSEKE